MGRNNKGKKIQGLIKVITEKKRHIMLDLCLSVYVNVRVCDVRSHW